MAQSSYETLRTKLGLITPHICSGFEDNSLKGYEYMVNYVK